MSYFFDSSAIIEILEGNPKYEKFLDNALITTTLNLSDVYYYLLRQNYEQTADYAVSKIKFHFLNIEPESAINAAKFRKKYYKEGISFADCIGYVLALENNLKFLTGDNDFKDKSNVEFVE